MSVYTIILFYIVTRNDIAEILLKVALNTININNIHRY